MTHSRRDFLRVASMGAAAVVVPSVPVVGQAGQVQLIEGVVGETIEFTATPGQEYPWKWYVSTNGGESYHEEFSTEQEAVACAEELAKENDGVIVAECQQQDYSLHVGGDDVLELLYGNNEEYIGDGDFIDASGEQVDDLGKMVTEAIHRWAAKHQVRTTAWVFGAVRNERTFFEVEPKDAAPSGSKA